MIAYCMLRVFCGIIRLERKKWNMGFKNYEESSLFETGRKLASGKGWYSMGDVSYREGYSDENTILTVNNDDDLNSRWSIYERKRVQSMKPASAYHQTAIARDIANVKKRRS